MTTFRKAEAAARRRAVDSARRVFVVLDQADEEYYVADGCELVEAESNGYILITAHEPWGLVQP